VGSTRLPAVRPNPRLRDDENWQRAFLAHAGTSIEALRALLGPAQPVVEPLLTIPFFLRRLVDLADAGLEAAVAHGDALGVVLTLLNEQINADPNLKLVRPAVGSWLGRVALLMQLTGRRTVALEDVRPLTADLELGDIDLLTSRLASRSLLEEAADRWSFGHRIFSEALVADTLTREAPGEWLDIVAPVFDGRSAVREDWLAPLDLVCARNGAWREALRRRDEVTVARLTPSSARPAPVQKSVLPP
jgi:hypothetical protein